MTSREWAGCKVGVGTVIDLDGLAWKAIKQAAYESKWMPPEYTTNHWLHDVCDFLRNGPEAFDDPEDAAWRAYVNAFVGTAALTELRRRFDATRNRQETPALNT